MSDDAALAAHDPGSFAQTLTRVGTGFAARPLPALRWASRLSADLVKAGAQSAARALGWQGQPALSPAPKDRRFADPAWEDHPWFLSQRQAYLAWSRHMRDLPALAHLEGPEARKAGFAVEALVDALAPTNFLWGNPAALRKAADTGGASVLGGLGNLVADVADNHARPRQVDASAFAVGENLGATPGKVVFRNELIELIQYEPTTETVFATPLLLSPPWINRYYIMDLAPGRSFVEWAVAHGHSTFAISYRNPDESMRDVGLDDYLVEGLGAAVDVVRQITGAPRVNLAGLCVGGTLSVMLMAWLADAGEDRVRSTTLLNTLVDFSEPGPLASFTDDDAVTGVERRMAERGFLDGREMASTFDALRANDLIWNYVGANWLMGEAPPAFDILAWNADATRISEAAHSQYLRSFYLENRLAKGTMTLAGRPLRLERISTETYVLGAREDHITPWTASYASTALLSGAPVRFVLSSAGHIAGIVNPPGPKRRYWTNEAQVALPPEEWLSGAEEHTGSWWEDWADWIKARAGRRRRPPPMGSAEHPVLEEAPGTYVYG